MAGYRGRRTVSRRTALQAPLPLLGLTQTTPDDGPEVRVDIANTDMVPFRREEFEFVGVYDVDWLTTPEFTAMLDLFAASPGAFAGVRFFGALTAGQPELFQPESGGSVWVDPDGPMDFTSTFAALEAVTSRGLTPFIVLSFFPPAVSSSPIAPPPTWEGWQSLVRAFLEGLAADPRFGPERIAGWWFEVWNEPNEGRFWSGTQEDYFDLYRATSEAAAEIGLSIRLGGPAIAYQPQLNADDGLPWMERFLRFAAADPGLRLDFISFHRKGTVQSDPPDPRRLHQAAVEVAELALAIDGERFAGLPIVNNEADEKVGFEVPYRPRMDHIAASWLSAALVTQSFLTNQSRAFDLRFMAAADNANLQLMEAPFDGRRSLVTFPGEDRTDLIKLPVYHFYELLRLFDGHRGKIVTGADLVYPRSDLYLLTTASNSQVSALMTYYPDPATTNPGSQTVDLAITGIPSTEVNVALFVIDRMRSNSYTAAGGSAANPFPNPDPELIPGIRQAQELALARPITHGVELTDDTWRERLRFEPYTTICIWITPYSDEAPEPPAWLAVDVLEDRAVLRWEPSRSPSFFSYEVFRREGDAIGERLSPYPLRAAVWVDDRPGRDYGVRTISASGIPGPIAR